MALANFMRLSLMKAAHADLSGIAQQEFGYAPVEMTKLWLGIGPFPMENQLSYRNNLVISTGAQRSGEICGLLFPFSHTLFRSP